MAELIEDLRFFIGTFFLIVGALLTIEGLSTAPRAGDPNLNLWAGTAFLAFSGMLVAWAIFARPRRRG